MIISDLNYIEEVNNETQVVGGVGVFFDKVLNADINTDLDFDVNVDVDKNVDIDIDIDAAANVEGNSAQLTFDVEAFGIDTVAELEFSILTIEDELSSVAGFAVSAVN